MGTIRYDITRGRDDVENWLVCHLLAYVRKHHGEAYAASVVARGGCDVTLTINNIDVNIVETYKHLFQRMDDTIRKRAAELLDERLGALATAAEDIAEAIRDKADEVWPGIGHTDEDWR